MKMNILKMAVGLATVLGACQEADYLLFNGDAHIQMGKENEDQIDFFYQDPSVRQDTAYLEVVTIGDPVDRVRKIAFEQIPEYDVEYRYDDKGNVTDTITIEKANKAVPGVHYIPMDDPQMQPYLVIPANAVSARIPVFVLRDPSLKKEEYRLCLQLKATDDFLLGEKARLSGVVVFADKPLKPTKWKRVEKYYFGAYSVRKHEFMYQIAGEKIDDEWITRIMGDFAELNYFKGKFKQALADYNADEENIARGLAPMRENPDAPAGPENPLITFPR